MRTRKAGGLALCLDVFGRVPGALVTDRHEQAGRWFTYLDGAHAT